MCDSKGTMGKRDDNKKQRRAAALDAARTLLADGGADALSMRRLASQSGLAVNTLYALFDSREGVLLAVIEDGIRATHLELDADPAANALQRCALLVERSVQSRIDAAAYVKPMYQALAAHIPEQDAGLRIAFDVTHRLFVQGRSEGWVRDDVDLVPFVEMLLRNFVDNAKRWALGHDDDNAFLRRAQHAMWLMWRAVATSEAMAEVDARLRLAEAELRRLR